MSYVAFLFEQTAAPEVQELVAKARPVEQQLRDAVRQHPELAQDIAAYIDRLRTWKAVTKLDAAEQKDFNAALDALTTNLRPLSERAAGTIMALGASAVGGLVSFLLTKTVIGVAVGSLLPLALAAIGAYVMKVMFKLGSRQMDSDM